MTQKEIQSTFFFSVFALCAVAGLYLLRSYLTILLTALAFAIMCRPIFNWFFKRLKASRGASAFLVTLTVFFAIILPLAGLFTVLGSEVGQVYGKLQQFLATEQTQSNVSPAVHWLADHLRQRISSEGSVGAVISIISSNAASVFSGFTDTLFGLILFFISFYYFTKDGHVFRQKLFGISPLSDASEQKIYNTVLVAINAVMRGTLIIAVLQGALAGLGFWMFGVGAPILLGILTIFASLVPLLGTGLVLVPAIGFLLVKGSTSAAIGLGLWSGVAVGLIDNILKPKLIEQGLKIHPLLILLSILGGLQAFGFLGFIIGPLVLAVAWALAEIYREEFHPHDEATIVLDEAES